MLHIFTKRLEKFHQTSLRRIARIKWFHKQTNYEVLSLCKIGSMQSMVESAILRWTGHVTRMSNDRTPKKLLYGRLTTGRTGRGNHATYINQVKRILRSCNIASRKLEKLAANRPNWRRTYKAGINIAEVERTNHLIAKRERRKLRAGTDLTQST